MEELSYSVRVNTHIEKDSVFLTPRRFDHKDHSNCNVFNLDSLLSKKDKLYELLDVNHRRRKSGILNEVRSLRSGFGNEVLGQRINREIKLLDKKIERLFSPPRFKDYK